MSALLEKILSRDNMLAALDKVKANKGAGGIDGISVNEIDQYLKENWVDIRDKIRRRKHKPKPVRRVEIPKPNGGVRNLGIPTVVDRVIEQAIVQVLTPIAEPHFSEYSYGFRPNRRAQQAIIKLLEYFNDGYTYIVDIDLEKFFDNVPQDKLMTLVHNLINDPDTESLIRKYLNAGVMIKGKYEATTKGTPQGGNLSPLLSNIMLNELDKELEARGLHFVRYADDCVIAVGSSAAANRVMATVTKWIEKKLGLKVNATKSKVTKPTKLKYLGFGFWKDSKDGLWKAKPHKDSIERFQRKLKQLTKRSWSVTMDYRIMYSPSFSKAMMRLFMPIMFAAIPTQPSLWAIRVSIRSCATPRSAAVAGAAFCARKVSSLQISRIIGGCSLTVFSTLYQPKGKYTRKKTITKNICPLYDYNLCDRTGAI